MKGQTQAVTAVLITSVVVGSVATAYVWGTPILEKRQSKADLSNVESQAFNLYSKVLEVSRSGSGTTEKITFSGDAKQFKVHVNAQKDYIDITSSAKNPPYPIDTWSLIKGKNMQNLTFSTGEYALEGEDQPGVVAVKPAGGPGESVVVYRVEFRNMYVETPTGAKLKKIDIQSQGRYRSSGETTLLISNEGTELDAGKNQVSLSNGRRLERTRTVVNVDIR